MKLNSGVQIPDRLYYYLLDFKDDGGHQYMWDNWRKESIGSLTQEEIITLTNYAMLTDLKLITHE